MDPRQPGNILWNLLGAKRNNWRFWDKLCQRPEIVLSQSGNSTVWGCYRSWVPRGATLENVRHSISSKFANNNFHVCKWLTDYYCYFCCSGAEVTDCGKWLLITPLKDCRDNLVYFTPLEPGKKIDGKLKLTKIVDKFEADYEVSNLRDDRTEFWKFRNWKMTSMICFLLLYWLEKDEN